MALLLERAGGLPPAGERLPDALAKRVAEGWVLEDFGALLLRCERDSVPGAKQPDSPQGLSQYEHLANHTHLEDVLPIESPYDPVREVRLAVGWARALLRTAFEQTGCRCTALIQVGGAIERGVVWIEQRRPGIDLHDVGLGGDPHSGYQPALAVMDTDDAGLDDPAADTEWRRAADAFRQTYASATSVPDGPDPSRRVELGPKASTSFLERLDLGHALGPTLKRELDFALGSAVALVPSGIEPEDLADFGDLKDRPFDWSATARTCRPFLIKSIRAAMTSTNSVVVLEDAIGSASRGDPFLGQWPALRFVTCTSRRYDIQAGRVVVLLSAAEAKTHLLDDALSATSSRWQTVAVCDWRLRGKDLEPDLTERRLTSLARRARLVAVSAYSGAGLAIWSRGHGSPAPQQNVEVQGA